MVPVTWELGGEPGAVEFLEMPQEVRGISHLPGPKLERNVTSLLGQIRINNIPRLAK